jgi:fibronectin type 3 domain-containing protein
MKRIFFLIVFTLFLYPYGQSQVTPKDIKVAVRVKGKSLDLRWAPSDYNQYYYGKINGVKITRSLLEDLSGPLDLESVINSRINLPTVFPYGAEDFLTYNLAGTPLDSVLQGIVFENIIQDTLPPNSSDYKLAHAMKYKENRESYFINAILVSDGNFHAAKALGLGLSDSPSIGNKYAYTVTYENNGVEIARGYIEVSIPISSGINNNPTYGPFIDYLNGVGNDKTATLSWDVSAYTDHYSAYNIYRSSNNGATFQKINQDPFVFFGSSYAKEAFASYTDSLPQNNFNYVYYIKGISIFGDEGPVSDTVAVKGRPNKLKAAVNIKGHDHLTSNSILLDWEVKPLFQDEASIVNNSIESFKVYFASKRDQEKQLLATQPLNSLARSVVISDPLDGYYTVAMKDINGYEYESIPQFVQAIDSIPPTTPSGLVAKRDSDGKVSLQWNSNPDSDLMGYKTYFAYNANGPFIELTTTYVVNPSFSTVLEKSNPNDSVYYRIIALDKRYNKSKPSSPALVVVPDETPPSQSILKHVLPTESGVRIAWGLSMDDDIASYNLQRKMAAQSTWTTILSFDDPKAYGPLPIFNGEVAPSNFIDTASLELRFYDYRIVATDQNGNASASNSIRIKPYNDGIRGSISNQQVSFVLPNTMYSAISGAISGGVNGSSVLKKALEKKVAKLKWQYTTSTPNSLLEFKIYMRDQTITGGGDNPATYTPPYTLLKTIPSRAAQANANMNNETGYVGFIEDIQWNRNFTTKDIKIIAYHNDGGFSLPVILTLPYN